MSLMRGLSSGEYTLSVISADEAGNETTTTEKVRIFEGTTTASGLFDVNLSQTGDVVKFDLYFKKIHPLLEDGVPAYSFTIDLEAAQLDFIEGSFNPSTGFSAVNEGQSASGVVKVSGFYQTPFDSYEDKFASFEAQVVSSSSAVSVSLMNIVLEYQSMGTFSTTVDI